MTLGKVLEAIDQKDLTTEKTWRLNERHYGALTGNLDLPLKFLVCTELS